MANSMATVAIWIGVIALAIAVGGLVVFLIASGAMSATRKPKTVVPGTRSARPAAPVPVPPARQPGGGAVLRPIVPVVVGQDDRPPAYPDGSGCGHEAAIGARFCTVCGRAAAGAERDIFVPDPTVTGTGAEITAVIPAFAAAEPADLTAPALASSRPAGRSLAGVATGPQAALADRPLVPGPQAGLPSRPPAAFSPVPTPQAGLPARPPAPRSPVPGPRGDLPARPPAPFPPVPGPQPGLAGRPPAAFPPVPVPQPGLSARPPAVFSPVPTPQAGLSARPPAPRSPDPHGDVGASPPWGWADPPAAAASSASPAPPWGHAENPPAPPESHASSGPPWDWAERVPSPDGAKPDGDGANSRPSGRHRSRRP
jgi:hypothetical protein